MHDPHSPCSQAFFEPGRPSRSRSTNSRLSPSQTSSAVRRLAVDRAVSRRIRGLLPRRSRLPGPAQRPPGQHGQRVPAVGRRCRARRRWAAPRRRPARRTAGRSASGSGRRRFPQSSLGQRAARNSSAARRRSGVGPAEPMPVPTAPRRPGSQRQRERADGDHHRVPGADLGELLRAGARPAADRRDQLVRGAATLRLTPVKKSATGISRVPRTEATSTAAPEREQRRVAVAGRRGGAEVAADRAPVADLRRARPCGPPWPARAAARRSSSMIRRVRSPPAPSRTLAAAGAPVGELGDPVRSSRAAGRRRSKLSSTITSVPPGDRHARRGHARPSAAPAPRPSDAGLQELHLATSAFVPASRRVVPA